MSTGKLDFKLINDRALQSIDSVLTRWLPGGKRQGNEYVIANPTRSDSHAGSFSVNLTNGIWCDFATGDKGGDLIALVAYVDRTKNGEACKALGQFLGIDPAIGHQGHTQYNAPPPPKQKPPSPDFEPIRPIPEGALKSCPTSIRNLGKPSQYWDYLDSDGKQILLRVMRFDNTATNGRPKDYRPFCYGKNKTGRVAWHSKAPTISRPLYGLHKLATTPATAKILLCEGEKAAGAAQVLFPDAVAMTWPSGSKAISKADFTPLRSRVVWYWPDNDKAGSDSIAPLRAVLGVVGVTDFTPLNIKLFAQHSPSTDTSTGKAKLNTSTDGAQWPDKADAADALALGWTSDHIDLLLEKGLIPTPQTKTPPPSQSDKNNGGNSSATFVSQFKSSDSGLYYFDQSSDQAIEIGSRLDIVAQTRDERRRSWGLLVSFPNKDNEVVEWNIPYELLGAETGVEVIKGLLTRGYRLKTTRAARRRLTEYLGDHPCTDRVTIVNQMGWQKDRTFMLPTQIIGEPTEPIRYYSDEVTALNTSTAGSLEDWQEHIAKHCLGNSRLSLAVCTAFAAPMLHLLGENESLGVHILGASRSGKSTALEVAASVYGQSKGYKQSWRQTDNHIESMAAAFNDCLLVLDEIAEMDNTKLGNTVYMLGNGKGKGRSGITGRSLGSVHTWKLAFLSSGEESLEQLLRQAGKKLKAGHEMRFLTVPCYTHKNEHDSGLLGGYETASQFKGGAELSDHFKQATNTYYGTPLITLLEKLVKTENKELISFFKTIRENFAFLHLSGNGKGGQAESAVKKFSILAGAGEFATKHGITGWPEGWATAAVARCFHAWVNQRGGVRNLEDRQALDHVREMLSRYGESRFSRWESEDARIDEHAPRTMERWGFRKTLTEQDSMLGDSSETIYYLTRDGLKDMCKGFDIVHIARLLKERGALETDKEEGRLTKKVRLPGSGKKAVNCYVINLSALLVDDDSLTGEDGSDTGDHWDIPSL